MLDQITKAKIDVARDILVGKVPDPKSQIEQITAALIYKFMDDMDAQNKEIEMPPSFFKGKLAQFSWSKLMSPKISGSDRWELYTRALGEFGKSEQVHPSFRTIFSSVYVPFRDPQTLNLFLKKIGEFRYDNSEKLGDAYEYLLSILGSQGDAGQFRTPRHIIDFMVEVVAPKKSETILDPACGTAGFLISAYKHIIKTNSKNYKKSIDELPFVHSVSSAYASSIQSNGRYKGDKLTPDDRKKIAGNIIGYDIAPEMVRLSLVNLYLHGFKNPKIDEYNVLTNKARWDDSFDVIFANPPFMSPRGGIQPHKKFTVQANRAEVLFVDYIAEHLNKNGRAAIIVPEGIIFQTANAYKTLRKKLINDWGLYAVVSLPSGVFNPYSGVKTSILFIDRALARKTSELLFVEVKSDGYDLGAQRRMIKNNDLPSAYKILRQWQSNLSINSDENIAHTTAKEKIIESDGYHLSSYYYSESGGGNHNWPMVKLREFCEISAGNTAPQDQKFFENGTYPFFRTSDVGAVHLSDNLRDARDLLNDRGAANLRMFRKGTILFPKSGASTFLNHRAIMGVDGYVSSHLATIAPDTSRAISKFVYYLLMHVDAKALTPNQSYPSLKTSTIGEIKIPLPPIEMQEKILQEIEKEEKTINQSNVLIDRANRSIANKIKEVWGQ